MPEALAEHVLSQYELGEAPACYLYHRGINDVYMVQTGQQRWMLRVTAANSSSLAAVQGEIDLLCHLQSANVAAVRPVARRDGAYVTVLHAPEGERSAVLFDFIDQTSTQDIPEEGRAYGVVLAQMHNAADTCPALFHRPHYDYQYFVEKPLASLDGFTLFAGHKAALDYIHKSSTVLWKQANQLPMTIPYYGFCHGDATSGNALYGNGGTVTLIDFDYGGIGWRVYDLATYIWAEIINDAELTSKKQALFRALLEGYQSVRPLSTDEFEALPVFAGLRQLFLFGAAIKNVSAFGAEWMSGDWLATKVEFIRGCQNGDWLARVGLR